jgi:hypothetical protein
MLLGNRFFLHHDFVCLPNNNALFVLFFLLLAVSGFFITLYCFGDLATRQALQSGHTLLGT